MAGYGFRVRNRLGQVIFDTTTHAALGIKSVSSAVSGSLVDPLLALGEPWAVWSVGDLLKPRPCTVSITGTTLSWTLPTAGLTPAQILSPVTIRYGVK